MDANNRERFDAHLDEIRRGWQNEESVELMHDEQELTENELARLAIYSAQMSAS